jgi:hypothetical protein
MVRRRLLGRCSFTEAAERRCRRVYGARGAPITDANELASRSTGPLRLRQTRKITPLAVLPMWRGRGRTPLLQSQRLLAMVCRRKASPPAEVGASPDRVGVGRGELAEQLDVVDLVVEACRGSS